MSGRPRIEGQVCIDALRRFPNQPIKTIARYLIHVHPDLFNADVEVCRLRLRYYAGKNGQFNRNQISDKSLFRGEFKMPKSIEPVRTPYKLNPGLWLVLSDIHVPFHSEKAVNIALEYGKMNNINGILFNGDLQDCKALGYWPTKRRDFLKEVELTIDFFDFINSEFPDVEKIWKPGNHEDRLEIYYTSNAPQLVGLPSSTMEEILSLETRKIEFLHRKQKVIAGKLPILHGHELRGQGQNSISPARWLFLKTKGNAACSHFHRKSDFNTKTISGKTVYTWTFGCLCGLEPDYNPEANDWNWGFSLIDVQKNGDFEVENREIMASGRII